MCHTKMLKYYISFIFSIYAKLWCFHWSINRNLCIKININLFSWIYHCYHHSIKLVFSIHEWDTWKYDLIYTYKATIWLFKFYNISWITAKPTVFNQRPHPHSNHHKCECFLNKTYVLSRNKNLTVNNITKQQNSTAI